MGTANTASLTDDKDSVVSAEDLTQEAPPEEDDGLRMTGLEVTYPSQKDRPVGNIVSQDEDGPSQRTRSKTNALLAAIELSGSCLSAKQAAARAYPLQFLADFAGAVVDDETGELLEYRHSSGQIQKRLGLLFWKQDWAPLCAQEGAPFHA